jgi:hypothetical protein
LALAGRPGAAADGIFNAEGTLSHDNNLSRASSDADIVSDTALNLAASGGYYFVPGDRDTVTLTGDLRTSRFWRFHGMSSVALGGTASWRSKFGVGAFIPWMRVSASVAGERYGEGIRDGQRSSLALHAGSRLSERLELSGSGSLDRYSADDVVQVVPTVSGDAFSLRGKSIFARAVHLLGERWLGFADIAFRRGDVVASTRRDPQIFAVSTAVTRDPAFGPDYIAYRLTGTTQTYSAGASLVMTDSSTLHVAATRTLTRATDGLDYRSTQINAGILYSY